MGYSIGVDLGQVFSCVVAIQNEDSRPVIIPFADSTKRAAETLPSVVGYPRVGLPRVGGQALSWAGSAPTQTVYSFKRLLGQVYDDPVVQRTLSGLGWRAIPDAAGLVAVQLEGKAAPLPLVSIASQLLHHMYETTAAVVGKKTDVVAICVPACFKPPQGEAVLEAAQQAGWPEPTLCLEPLALAAVLARSAVFENQAVALCDFGGGKFEASVVEFGAPGSFRLLSTCGEPLLGGEDLDRCIAEGLLAELSEQLGSDLMADGLARLRVMAELAATRTKLNQRGETELQLPFLALKPDGTPLHARLSLTQERCEHLVSGYAACIEEICQRALARAGIDRYDTRGNVLTTEGYSALRAYRQAVERGLGTPRYYLRKHFTAYGAALLASHVSGGEPGIPPEEEVSEEGEEEGDE